MLKKVLVSSFILGITISSCAAMGAVKEMVWGPTLIPRTAIDKPEQFEDTFQHLHQNRNNIKLEEAFTIDSADIQHAQKLAKSEQNTLLDYALPSCVLKVDNPSEIKNSDLFMKVGDRVYQFKVESFLFAYDHTLLKAIYRNSLKFLAGIGAWTVYSWLPQFLTFPVTTAAFLGGGTFLAMKYGFLFSSLGQLSIGNAKALPSISWEGVKEILLHQLSKKTTVQELVENNEILTTISLDGKFLTFEGTFYDGFWGLQKKLEIRLSPVAHMPASYLQG